MQRTPVASSQISSIGYDSNKRVLEIEFRHKGAVYTYSGVSQEAADALLHADSVGKHFNRFIKDRYDFTKVG